MKIEKLKPQFCQQAMGYDSICGELAVYRITTDDTAVSVAYCQDHALKFLDGKRQLTPLICKRCGVALRPGYFMDVMGRTFCNEICHAAWDHSSLSEPYR